MPMNRKHKRQNTQGAEAGFTLIELIIVIALASILNIFIFSIITKSLASQINMQERKVRSDEAVLSLERIGRELREATNISNISSNQLIFEKNVTSSADANIFVKFVRNSSTNELRRQSSTTYGGLPGNDTSGDIIAKNVTVFSASPEQSYGSSLNVIVLDLTFENGSAWRTKVFPRNYGL